MKKESFEELLPLLVRVYNHTILCYRYFPDVIIYGVKRLEPEDFSDLLSRGYVERRATDSFGSFYHLTEKAESLLNQKVAQKRRRRLMRAAGIQPQLPFLLAAS